MMKKMFRLSLLFLLGASLSNVVQATDSIAKGVKSDVTGHTFFTVRPPFQAASPEQVSLFRGWGHARGDCGIGGALQIVPFGGQSTRHKGLARYFMFNDKHSLVVAGDNAIGVGTALNANNGIGRDVNAIHFNIRSAVAAGNTFKSTIRFRPRQTFAGVGLEYRQYLGWNECCERRWWLDISMPIEWVKNDMRLTETVDPQLTFTPAPATTTTGPAAANMTQAFTGAFGFKANDPWLFGKIVRGRNVLGTSVLNNTLINTHHRNHRNHKVRLADIELKFGYDWVCTECCYAESYLGVLIPTGNRPRAEFVFEPIVGNNFHVGIMTGGSFGYKMWCGDCDRELWLAFDINNRYLFANHQTRSFDLFGKPWSRYMAVWATPADAAESEVTGVFQNLTNGINVFTRRVRVHPRFATNFTTALVYNQCSLQAELGYNFYARQSEKVRFRQPWVEGPILACPDSFVGADEGIRPDAGTRAATIGANFADSCVLLGAPVVDPVSVAAVTIRAQDIDINTAASPCALSHTVYGTLGWCFDACDWPLFVGVGGSYEFSGVNTILNRWMVWGKVGFGF